MAKMRYDSWYGSEIEVGIKPWDICTEGGEGGDTLLGKVMRFRVTEPCLRKFIPLLKICSQIF